MAFPTPMYVELKNGSYLTIAGALLQTKDTVINYEQNNYRDQPPVLPAVSSASGAAAAATSTAAVATPGIVGSGLANTVTSVSAVDGSGNVEAYNKVESTSSVLQDDNYTHMAPRPQMFLRDRFRWWDKANPGAATTITGTTVNASPLVSVGSIEGLFVGQAVSGTGIPANAVIQELKYVLVAPTASIQPTLTPTIVLSSAATAGGAVTLTIAAGADGAPNLLGECWCDRYIGWSSGIPTRF